MIDIHINDRPYTAPTSWNELTPAQALHLYALLASATPTDAQGQPLPAPQASQALYIQVMRLLLAMPQQHLDSWRRQCIHAHGPTAGPLHFHSQLQALTHAVVAPFFAPAHQDADNAPPTYPGPALTLTTCPYSTLSGPDAPELHAPPHALEGITLSELATIFTLLEDYTTTPTAATATQLLATIYRPAKPATATNVAQAYGGDIRQPLHRHEAAVPLRAQHLQSLPPTVRGLLIFWLFSCRQAIVQQFPNLFSRDAADLGPLMQRTGNDYGWAGVILQLADGLIHADTVANKPWRDAFIYMSYLEDQRITAQLRADAAAAEAKAKSRR